MVHSFPHIGFLLNVVSSVSFLVAASQKSVPDAVSFIQAWGTHNATNWREDSFSDFDEEVVVDYRRMLTKDYVLTFYDDATCNVESKIKSHELVRVTQNVGCYDTLKRKLRVDSFKLSGSFKIVCTSDTEIKQLFYGKASCRGDPIGQKLMRWDFFKGHCENRGRLRPALRSKHFPDCKRDTIPSAATQLVGKVTSSAQVPDVPWCFDPVNRRPCDDVDSIGLMKPIITEEKKMIRKSKTSSLEAKQTKASSLEAKQTITEKTAELKSTSEPAIEEAADATTAATQATRAKEVATVPAVTHKTSVTQAQKSNKTSVIKVTNNSTSQEETEVNATKSTSATPAVKAVTEAPVAKSAATSSTSNVEKATDATHVAQPTTGSSATQGPIDLNKPETSVIQPEPATQK